MAHLLMGEKKGLVRLGETTVVGVYLTRVKKAAEEKHERKWRFRPVKASQPLLPVNTQTILTINALGNG